MNENFAATKTCAHPPCSCEVGPDEKYCNVQCEAMEDMPDLACECHHSNCKGDIGA